MIYPAKYVAEGDSTVTSHKKNYLVFRCHQTYAQIRKDLRIPPWDHFIYRSLRRQFQFFRSSSSSVLSSKKTDREWRSSKLKEVLGARASRVFTRRTGTSHAFCLAYRFQHRLCSAHGLTNTVCARRTGFWHRYWSTPSAANQNPCRRADSHKSHAPSIAKKSKA